MPIALNNDSIQQTFEGLIHHLHQRNAASAHAYLQALAFERLETLVPDRSKGSKGGLDPAQGFGRERVHETGEHLRACRAALAAGELELALQEAEAALARWMQGNAG